MSRTKGTIDHEQYATSLQDIANHFGKTKEWARQEVDKAITKIAASGKLDAFRDLLSRGPK